MAHENGEQPTLERTAFQYFEQIQTNKILTFYLSNEIAEPEYYVEMIHRIRTASPQDLIYIILNTRGGSLETGIQLINAMQSTQATVITVIEGECHSLGTIIFLSGDEFIVNDYGLMMFHNFRGIIGGKGNEQAAQIQATVKWFTKLVKKIYFPFLSQDEINRLLKGEDFWIDSDEIRTRLKKMVKILEEHEEEKIASKKKRVSKKKKLAKKDI